MILTYKAGVFQMPKFFQKGKDVIHPYNLEDWYTPYGFIFPVTSEALSLKLFFMDGVKGIDTMSKVSCHHVLDADGNFFRYFLATASDSDVRAFVSRRLLSVSDDWFYAFSADAQYEEQMTALWLKYRDSNKALSSFLRLNGRYHESFTTMTKNEIIENLKVRGFTKRYKFEDRVEATLEAD